MAQNLHALRHSAAHLMAAAIQSLYPSAKFGVGPATEEGFYYDVRVDPPITSDDLPRIEKEMRRLAKRASAFAVEKLPVADAIGRMKAKGQPYKVELLELLRTKGTTAVRKEFDDDMIDPGAESIGEVTFYTVGNFEDLCKGPHVGSASEISHFKLLSLAGAYWRGDADRDQLQRVYGTAFFSAEDLKDYLTMLEERKRRDHRKLGRELELFRFSENVGSGLPIWLPRGNIIREEIELLAREYEQEDGYQRVTTPILAKEQMYLKSGHLPYYAEDMYAPIEIDGTTYYLRPMNCPHHHEIYLAQPRSYRDLPFRVTEYGTVFRYEASGGLSGLMRTRGFCQNDAHIYCAYSQARDEFLAVMRLHARYYTLFGIEKFYMRLALPDMSRIDKYVDQPESWVAALDILRSAMEESGLEYVEAEGEAAFYGPKVDFMIKSATGQEYAISTNQLDFLASQRFNLTYTSADGSEQPVYVIHRAPLGSHERFVAFLIEHFGGDFPTWLAPQQVTIIPIADRHQAYATAVRQALRSVPVHSATGFLRVDVNADAERMQKKIRLAETRKVPYVCIVGDSEVESNSVSVRSRAQGDLGSMTVETFRTMLIEEVDRRMLPRAHQKG